MRKMKKINGYLVVRFNDREKREYAGTGLGSFGVIDAEQYTGILDVDRSAMEYDGAETLEEAVELARGLESELDVEEPETKITVIVESDRESSEEEVHPEQLFQAEKDRQEGLIRSGFYPVAAPVTAAHRLSGYVRALEDLGMIDSFDERFLVTSETFQAAEQSQPERTGQFKHPPGQMDGLLASQVYRLGMLLEDSCPDNDCVVYRSTFRMARELDDALDILTGLAASVVRREFMKLFGELRRMYLENHAVKAYRRQGATMATGLEMLRDPDATAEQIADIISTSCPVPIAEHCDSISCRDCWLSWLTTGRPPEEAENRPTEPAPTPPSEKGAEHEQDPEA